MRPPCLFRFSQEGFRPLARARRSQLQNLGSRSRPAVVKREFSWRLWRPRVRTGQCRALGNGVNATVNRRPQPNPLLRRKSPPSPTPPSCAQGAAAGVHVDRHGYFHYLRRPVSAGGLAGARCLRLPPPPPAFSFDVATLGLHDDVFFEGQELHAAATGVRRSRSFSTTGRVPLAHEYSELAAAKTPPPLEARCQRRCAGVCTSHFHATGGRPRAPRIHHQSMFARRAIKAAIAGRRSKIFKFTAPLLSGDQTSAAATAIGLHHAGVLPTYAVLVDHSLDAKGGLLSSFCRHGTLPPASLHHG